MNFEFRKIFYSEKKCANNLQKNNLFYLLGTPKPVNPLLRRPPVFFLYRICFCTRLESKKTHRPPPPSPTPSHPVRGIAFPDCSLTKHQHLFKAASSPTQVDHRRLSSAYLIYLIMVYNPPIAIDEDGKTKDPGIAHTHPSNPMRRGAYVEQATRATGWAVLYLVGWLLMRLSCYIGLPDDCDLANEPLEVLTDLLVLLVFCLTQVNVKGMRSTIMVLWLIRIVVVDSWADVVVLTLKHEYSRTARIRDAASQMREPATGASRWRE